MSRPLLRWAAAAAVLLGLAVNASAQQGSATAPRFELSAALRGTASSSLGGAAASLTPNTGQPAFTLFNASGDLGAHAGADIWAGWRVAGGLKLSFSAGLSQPVVQVRIQGDAEGAPDTSFDGESLLQWAVGGRADYELRGWRFASGRATPFVSAGAGVLWQSHESRVSTETGQYFEGGAGITWMLRHKPSSRLSRVALVAEVRVSHVVGGFHWGQDARTMPGFGVGIASGWGRLRKAS